MIAAALSLITEILSLVPAPDQDLRRARIIGRLVRRIARLERLPVRTPLQDGRLAEARAVLASLTAPVTEAE